MANELEVTSLQASKQEFCVFSKPEFGIRAMGKILRNYQTKHNKRSIEQMVRRWAPPSDGNPTEDCISLVVKYVGIGRGEAFDVTDMRFALPMVEGMIFVENGRQTYDDTIAVNGLSLAGIS